ncbi:hypothetical protein CA951_40700 [Rhodococcus sp. NCIMB 12038]|jgi:hypothetical protein|nr:hypothetical protein CA951_40700 [Rhodococcus sp. NCIMB 12038]
MRWAGKGSARPGTPTTLRGRPGLWRMWLRNEPGAAAYTINDIHEAKEPLVMIVDDWHRITDPTTLGALDSDSPIAAITFRSW